MKENILKEISEEKRVVINNTILTKDDLLGVIKRPFKWFCVFGGVLLILSIALLYVEDDTIESMASTLIFLSLFFVVFGLLYPTLLKFLTKSIPNETIYNYTFSDNIKIEAIQNNIHNDITLSYDAIVNYKFKRNIHYLYNTKFVYYHVKDDGFKSEEDRQYFINKFKK